MADIKRPDGTWCKCPHDYACRAARRCIVDDEGAALRFALAVAAALLVLAWILGVRP